MPKSGLCLDCGNIIESDNENSVQGCKELTVRDGESVSEQAIIEDQQERLVVETSVIESVAVVDDVQAAVLPENVNDTSDSLEDQQTLDIVTLENGSAAVDGAQVEDREHENFVDTSDSIEGQQTSVVEATVSKSVIYDDPTAVLSENVDNTSDLVEKQQSLDIETSVDKVRSGEYSLPKLLLLEPITNASSFIEELQTSVVEATVNESVADDEPGVLSENVDNTPGSVENQQTLDIETPADKVRSGEYSLPKSLLLEPSTNASGFIEGLQTSVVETTVNESVAVDESGVLSENVDNTSGSVENQQTLDIETPANEPAVKDIGALNKGEYPILESLIGIKKLDPRYGSIEKQGLFVITAPLFSLAKSILVQTIIHNPYLKTALISFQERNEMFNVTPEANKKLYDIYNIGNLLLNVVCIKESKHLLSGIKLDMQKKAFASVDLVLIDIEQDIIMSATDAELAAILSSWQSWFVKHNKTCIWIVHGGMASGFVRSKFLNHSNMFNGLASIEFDASEIKYEVIFWHLHSSIQTNILLNLQFDEINHEITVTGSK